MTYVFMLTMLLTSGQIIQGSKPVDTLEECLAKTQEVIEIMKTNNSSVNPERAEYYATSCTPFIKAPQGLDT